MNWIKKPFLVNTLLVVISVSIMLFVAEILLRLTPYSVLIPKVGIPQYYYQADREQGFDIAPNFSKSTHSFRDLSYQIWSNELGCFDVPYHGEKPYIYLAGDSFTWGFAPFEDKWGTKLEKALGVRTLKCGVSGSGTKQELIKAERTLAKVTQTPKLIVLGYFGGNDTEDDYSFPNKLVYNGYLIKKLEDRTLDYDSAQKTLPQIAEWSEKYCMITRPANPTLQRVKCFLTEHSVAYHLMKNGMKRIVSGDILRGVGVVNEPVPGVSIQEGDYQQHLNNVLVFSKFAKTKGSDFLVVLVPLDGNVTSFDEVPDPYAKLKVFLTAHHIAYLDPLQDFRSAAKASSFALYWQHDPHWNVRGNHLFGLLVSKAVLERSPWVQDRDEKLSATKRALLEEFFIGK